MIRKLCLAGLIAAATAPMGPLRAGDVSRPADRIPGEITFERHIRPIFKANCFQCHGEAGNHEGGLDLRLRRFAVQGGDSGAVVAPGDSGKSLLYERVLHGEMPPKEIETRLTGRQIALIERWISTGAKTARPEPEELGDEPYISQEDRDFWAFQPIARPQVPAVKDVARTRTPVDRFLLARLEANGLTFSPDADKRTLLRRACFDLTGLPPTPEETEAFLDDDSPEAYERLIDRLLASQSYGERWGRRWLDVAGYADSEGYTDTDTERPYAYKYRDYVIRSFNADKPFDEFICEQLAGDEMVGTDRKDLSPEQIEKLVATGFLRMAPDGSGDGGVDQPLSRNEVVAKTMEIVSTSLLGLTVACAQCHDHRYDPISQADYYRLRAVFEPALNPKDWLPPQKRRVSLYRDSDRQASAKIEAEAKKIDAARLEKQAEYIAATFEKELAKLPEEIRDAVREAHDTPAKKQTPEQKRLLKEHPSVNVTAGSLYLYDRKAADDLKARAAEAAKLRATKPKEEFLRALWEPEKAPPETFLFDRGDHEQPKQKLNPSELAVLDAAPAPVNDPNLPTTGRRTFYARWLTSGKHPLTARVLVNRIWLGHFGRGIVATPGDFGYLGARPSHPELLDWLAGEFMRQGWSVKQLHRLLMTSTAYRQSSRRNPRHDAVDSDNALYGRMPLRRLEAEDLRDSILAVSGKLFRRSFGPPVPVMADRVGQFVIGVENLNAGRPGAVVPMHGEEFRRSVYVQVRRSRPLGVLDTFDAPAMTPNCTIRKASTVSPQSLMLMNGLFTLEQAEHFAARVAREAGADRQARIRKAWRLALAREPCAEELKASLAFLDEQTAFFKEHPAPSAIGAAAKPKNLDPDAAALATLCQALLSSNEFLYID